MQNTEKHLVGVSRWRLMLKATKLAKQKSGAVSSLLGTQVSVNTATPWQLQCWRKPSQTVPVPVLT